MKKYMLGCGFELLDRLCFSNCLKKVETSVTEFWTDLMSLRYRRCDVLRRKLWIRVPQQSHCRTDERCAERCAPGGRKRSVWIRRDNTFSGGGDVNPIATEV